MEISKREFLRKLGVGGMALAGGIALGDEGTMWGLASRL